MVQPSGIQKNVALVEKEIAETNFLRIFDDASDGMVISDLETGRVLAANPAAAEMHGYTREVFGKMRIQRLLQSKSAPFFKDYAQIILQNGVFEMLAEHYCQDETLISVEWRAVATQFQGKTCGLAILRDVSKRIRAEQQLQQRVGIRAHEQSILLEISQTLASTLELAPGQILEQLGTLIQNTHAVLFAVQDLNLVSLAQRGSPALQKSASLCISLEDRQLLETVFVGKHAVRITDIWSNEPAAKLLRSLLQKDAPLLLEDAQSWMWVPMVVKKNIIGGFGFSHVARNYFTAHHANLAQSVANQAAITMINDELTNHAQELAVLEERQRLARNLHDAVNQSLFSAGLIAEVLPRLWDRDQVEARRSLDDLRRLTRGAQAEMRALLAELRPSTLTDSNLSDLLRLLGNAFTGRTNVPVHITISGENELPAEVQVAVYRICQETLNNIAKHAKAGWVEISGQHTEQPGQLDLFIRDNGRGYDIGQLPVSGHYGLSMMREHAQAANIRLTITSQPGKGSETSIYWKEKATL